ncbi:MAG: c-type cytochrome [Anaerolineae bacterium]|nr:c-type cytochrome [Anaerolineae bacterium]
MKRKALKWGGSIVLALLVTVVAALVGVEVVSENRLNKLYSVPAEDLTIPNDAATIERGKHIAIAIAQCMGCHGDNLAGKVWLEAPGMMKISTTNLTRGNGGIGATYTDADWIRTIRHGVRPDGKPARFMPSQIFNQLDRDDLAAVIAYVKSVPPVDNTVPPHEYSPLIRALFVTGQVSGLAAEQIDHNAPIPAPIKPGPTVEYGNYLVNVGNCRDCHGPTLSGGKIPGAPPEYPAATNITPTGIGSWTEADFFKALRNGIRPNGTLIDPHMPWPYLGQMSDDELKAVYNYLKTVPPKPTGNR